MSRGQHIQVFARCRPLNQHELRSVVEVEQEKHEVRVLDKYNKQTQDAKSFQFDRAFGPEARQCDIYRAVVSPLIEQVVMGYNCTVFAYGQTGTGKTYTMEGARSVDELNWEDDPDSGVIPRAISNLFDKLQNQGNEFSIKVSFLELYNEDAYDLLSSPEDTTKLKVFDDSHRKGSVIVGGLEEVSVQSKDEIYEILHKGAAKRQTAATLLNAASSRSHTIFTICVQIKEPSIVDEEMLKVGKLNLVDLAGSENIARSGAQNKQAREAGNINQSLLTLTRVITSLIEKLPHVPYRESKLTRILQDSLGGSTRTSMIATISPAEEDLSNTISTLDYASRARSIINRPESNRLYAQKRSSDELNRVIQALKDRHASEKSDLEFRIRNEVAQEFKTEIERLTYNAKNDYQARLDEAIKQRDQLIEQRDATIERLSLELSQRDREHAQRNQELSQELLEKEKRIDELEALVEQRTKEAKINLHLANYRSELNEQLQLEFKQQNCELVLKIRELEEKLQRNSRFQEPNSSEDSDDRLKPIHEPNTEQREAEPKKASKIRKHLPLEPEEMNDYADMTFDGNDEIVQVSAKKRKKVTLGGRKKTLHHPLTLSGKKVKLADVCAEVELPPDSPPVRVTRSRATRRKLNY